MDIGSIVEYYISVYKISNAKIQYSLLLMSQIIIIMQKYTIIK